MTRSTDTMKTQAQLAETGRQMRALLEANLSHEWNTLERPYPLAHVFAADKRDPMDIRSHELETTVSAYYGLIISGWSDRYLALYDALKAGGHLDEASSFEFGNDAYVWACAERDITEPADPKLEALLVDIGFGPSAPNTHQARAFVVQTQSRNFLVLLVCKFGSWSVHIRRFWTDLAQAKAGGGYFQLQEYAERRDLTLEDVLRLAHTVSEEYSDCVPGVTYVKRPNLAAFLDGTLLPGEDGAGVGLRYGDFRDAGYVVSYKANAERPEVDHGLACNHGELGYVAYNIASAIDQLVDGVE